jgi:Domain of unknown function (DUF4864)
MSRLQESGGDVTTSAIQRAAFAAIAFALLATLAFAQGGAGPTHPAAEWETIRNVVTSQRQALVAGDGERAFAFATPALRRQYGSAEAFMRMVRRGYQALVDARYVELLEGAVIDGSTIQPLRLVMPDGAVLVALYTMERQRDGSWRIAGCVIAPSTVKSA